MIGFCRSLFVKDHLLTSEITFQKESSFTVTGYSEILSFSLKSFLKKNSLPLPESSLRHSLFSCFFCFCFLKRELFSFSFKKKNYVFGGLYLLVLDLIFFLFFFSFFLFFFVCDFIISPDINLVNIFLDFFQYFSLFSIFNNLFANLYAYYLILLELSDNYFFIPFPQHSLHSAEVFSR